MNIPHGDVPNRVKSAVCDSRDLIIESEPLFHQLIQLETNSR